MNKNNNKTPITMVNISSIYPVEDDFKFDYYFNKHMPMSIELLSKSEQFIKVSVERGVDIQNPQIKSSYLTMCHYYFETLEGFMEVFSPNAEELQEDIKNYTNINPIIQINHVEILK